MICIILQGLKKEAEAVLKKAQIPATLRSEDLGAVRSTWQADDEYIMPARGLPGLVVCFRIAH